MLYDLKNPLQKENFKLRCNALFKKGCIVELTERKPQRSLRQNNYLFLLINYFASQYGCTEEEAENRFYKVMCNKALFLREINDDMGQYRFLRHTYELTTDEMSVSIDRFRNFASSQAGIYLPSADEGDYLIQAQIEVERNKRDI